jgi:primase-polymerase (primpol)-like protein
MIELPVVPDSLSEIGQWILWAAEFVPGKDAAQKIPYSAQTRRRASTTNPRDWSSFSHCASVWRRCVWEYSGVGFVFSRADPYCGVDLDDCLDDAGNPKRWARPILERFADTYMEISPGGRGIKIWAKAALEKAVVEPAGDGSIEIYSWGRYFTVTGRRWRGAPFEIEDHQADVTEMVQRLARPHVSYETNGHWTANPQADGTIPDGRRHPFLVSLAGTLRRRHLLPNIIEATLHMVNREMCKPPKPDQEISRIARDCLKWQ